MSAWEKVRRKGGEAPEQTPLVTFRRAGVAFNAAFVRAASLANKTHVAVQVDSAAFRVGFRFLDAPTDADCWALTHDGGGRGEGRWVQAGSLLQLPWIASVARIPDHPRRRFKPTWSGADSMWVVTLCPAFECRVSAASEIPSDARGIYRYLRGKEVMYIGRGVIRSRHNAPERREWDIETIEYSPIPDEAQQTHWESYWLDAFVQEHGKLPIYNRIGGASRSTVDEG